MLTTFVVDAIAPDDGLTFTEAVAMANATAGADTITFATQETIMLDARVEITDDLTIDGRVISGERAGTRQIISGGGVTALFLVDNDRSREVDLTLRDLRLIDGLTNRTSVSGVRFLSTGALSFDWVRLSGHRSNGNATDAGSGPSGLLISTGAQSSRIGRFQASEVSFRDTLVMGNSGLTLVDARAGLVEASGLRVRDNVGGAVRLAAHATTITDSRFEDNVTDAAILSVRPGLVGVGNSGSAVFTLTGSVVSGNVIDPSSEGQTSGNPSVLYPIAPAAAGLDFGTDAGVFSDITIAGTRFDQNIAENVGAVSIQFASAHRLSNPAPDRSTNVVIRDSQFSRNRARAIESSGIVGGLYVGDEWFTGPEGERQRNNTRLLISGSTFNRNEGGSFGGGAYLLTLEQTTVESTQFVRNTSTGSGGGLNVRNEQTTDPIGSLLIRDSLFRLNTAGSGGGLRAWSSVIRRTVFDRNEAATTGGGTSLSPSFLRADVTGPRTEAAGTNHRLFDVRFVGNHIANERDDPDSRVFFGIGGGGLFAFETSLLVVSGVLARNSVSALETLASTGETLENSRVVGGGAALFDTDLTIAQGSYERGTRFVGNRIDGDASLPEETTDGAGLYFSSTRNSSTGEPRFETTVRIADALFHDNGTTTLDDLNGGGALLGGAREVVVARTRFEENRAGVNRGTSRGFGGGLSLSVGAEATALIADSDFVGNAAATHGGGLNLGGGGTITLRDTVFFRNESPVSGGLFYFPNGADSPAAQTILERVRFVRNTETAAFYFGTVFATDVDYVGHSSSLEWGAIAVGGSSSQGATRYTGLRDRFINNSGSEAGGLLVTNDTIGAELTDAFFEGNAPVDFVGNVTLLTSAP